MRVLLLSFLLAFAYGDLVLTPFGYRPSECVLEVPHGSTVTPEEGTDKLIITTPATDNQAASVQYYAAPPHCGDDIGKIREKRFGKTDGGDPQVINGWLDYVGVYPPAPENNIKKFTSTYVVPNDPPNNQGTQTLFYFIGMQDNDSPNAVNILQPVLTWGNGNREWYVKSWICCPKNISTSSPPVYGLKAGSQLQGVISRESDSNWLVDSIFNGQHTTLNSQVGDYIYNWADITLEVYGVNNCPDLAKGQAFFNDLVLTDSKDQKITPDWQDISKATTCGGSIKPNGGDSYVIEHQY